MILKNERIAHIRAESRTLSESVAKLNVAHTCEETKQQQSAEKLWPVPKQKSFIRQVAS